MGQKEFYDNFYCVVGRAGITFLVSKKKIAHLGAFYKREEKKMNPNFYNYFSSSFSHFF